MKNLIILFLFSLIVISCNKRLDGFLFNNSQIEAYELDEYTGEKTFELTEEYDIPDELVHVFTYDIVDGDDILEIHAIYVGDISNISQDTVILYCHGNKDHMDFYWNRQKLLAHVGGKNRVGVLSFDYPGYGLSEGAPTEENMYESTRGAIDWLKNNGLTSERFFVYGFSLGSAPATRVAARVDEFSLQPQGLVLENPFASSEVMVQSSSALSFPDSYFTNIEIANAEEIKKVNQRFLWFHGTDDTFLTLEKHGQVVFDNYNGSEGIPIIVEGATHDGETGVPKQLGLQEYIGELEGFLGFN